MLLSGILLPALAVAGSPLSSPYAGFSRFAKRDAAIANFAEESLTVDLGYEIYKGWTNASASLNIWQGYVLWAVEMSGVARTNKHRQYTICPGY